MRVSIGGLPGSGTTTAAYLLKEKTGMDVISAGETFRTMAEERGVSLADFGRMSEEDDSIDRGLDARMIALAKSKEDIILEGRLIGALCKKESIPVLAVWLTAPPVVRAERISGRENEDLDTTTQNMLEREKSERTRYVSFYGIDNQELSTYDLVISSHEHRPESIVEQILEAMK